MPDHPEYTLCGGTFLTLLLRARRQRYAARRNAAGENDGLSDSEFFEGLIKVAFPDFASPAGRSFKTYTTQYKQCKLASNEYLPFSSDERIKIFHQEFFSNYSNPLGRMCDFSSSFLDERNLSSWLVRALLETIASDPSMDNETFYIDGNGIGCTRDELLKKDNIILQHFLLCLWYLILTRRPNNNGGSTYDLWHKPAETLRGRREFISDIGKTWNPALLVSLVTEIYTADNSEMADTEDPASDKYDIPDDKDPLLVPGGIAPELTGDAPWLLVPKGILSHDGEYGEYLDNAHDKYCSMKTLLYNDAPEEFDDFYVCNDISQKVYIKRYTYRTKVIHDATAETLHECSNFVLISGTGGLGKSMMMRHLLLDSIDRYEEFGKLPIFIPLKDYTDTFNDLLDFIFEKFSSLGGTDDINEFEELLTSGECLLLFDGLDEIRSDYRKKFEHNLDIFTDKYTDNMFVISSRPTGSFLSLNRFTVLDLCPFTKPQALSLIDKLKFRVDEPSIKERFKKELQDNLFVTHREFTENPLLLTIMLMTYEQFAEVPSKMHVFYREAYVSLSQKHDASKGAYKRVLKTGLTADQFADYFAEFCARTYRDEKFEFTEVLFDKYFNDLHEKAKEPSGITAADFRDDLISNMCLMFYESGKYHFTHRSFQEYFCALYFSKQKDKTLWAIGSFFENKRSRNYTDQTFNMLYDMIPEKIEEYIFEPYLEQLFKTCDEADGYWTFLQKMYPVLYYEDGDTNGCDDNDPESFLYDSIIHIRGINGFFGAGDLPCDQEFVTNEWVYLDDDYNDPDYDEGTLIDVDEVPWDYKEQYGEPDVVGRNYEIHVDEILRRSKEYKALLDLLSSDAFPLKTEYLEARLYLDELKDNQVTLGDDLFDLFQ